MPIKKSLSTSIIVFISIFCISVIYAALSGNLTMGGTVTFIAQADVELVFTDVDFDSSTEPREGEEVYLGYDDKTIDIDVRLIFPGDQRKIIFKIQNSEISDAKLGSWETDYPSGETDEITGIKIIWPDLENVVVMGGTIMPNFDYYEVLIEWDVDYYDITPGWHHFSASITYEQDI